MKSTTKIVNGVLLVLSLASCEKYVDIKTQGQLTPRSLESYRYLLNNTAELESAPTISDMASDDLEIPDGSAQLTALSNNNYNGYYFRAYQWADDIYPADNQYYKDDNWTRLYNTIAYANTVISEVPDASDGTSREKEALISEAKVHRAAAYLMLVNTYAKPYRAASAATDLGVPLLLELTTEQPLRRNSVQEVYDAILSDLQTSVDALPAQQSYTTLPSKASAYGLLARTHLYMNNYGAAAEAADKALAIKDELIDLTEYQAILNSGYPLRVDNPEILLSKTAINGTISYAPTAFRLSADLLSLFDSNDQRYNLFTVDGDQISSAGDYPGRYFYLDRAVGESRNVGPTVPEMLLIKAEAAARADRVQEAMDLLNTLRKKRILAAGYTDLAASNGAEALQEVIRERRREFMFRMLRWWDMRRLKDEAPFSKTYTRVINGQTVTLAPNSNRYVFPIAQYEINLNNELEPNP